MRKQYPLHPEIKEKFVKRLREGQYEQAKRVLAKNADCYCVLGVLCKIHSEEHETDDQWTPDDRCIRYMGEISFLPELVAEWVFDDQGTNLRCIPIDLDKEDMEKVIESSPHLTKKDIRDNLKTNLSGLNDAEVPFDVLAELIEKHL